MDAQQSYDEAAPSDNVCPRCGEYSKNGIVCEDCKPIDYEDTVEYLRLKGEL